MPNHENEEAEHLAILDEIEATQDQIHSYQGLLKDLPEIFERKFNERFKAILDRHQQLLDEREHLLSKFYHSLPGAAVDDHKFFQAESPSLADPARDSEGSFWIGRPWWLVGLAVLGVGFGMHLSQQLPQPGTKKTYGAMFPLYAYPPNAEQNK